MSKVIGIDLGTTNSCVAVFEGDQRVIIPNAQGGRTTPSVVSITRNGERLVGEAAKRQAVANPERTILSIKRDMGTDRKIQIDGKSYTPEEISAMILRQLRADAERYLGEPVTEAVITVPAYFTDAQRQATKNAGAIAGLEVRRIINEPTSAALAYGIDREEPQKILVYDLGGGTFDVSVLDISGGVIEVLAAAGNNRLGGDDFDRCVCEWLVREFRRENRVDLTRDPAAMQRIREAAEQAKIELSAGTSAEINLPYITAGKDGPKHLLYVLTRAEFDRLTEHLVRQTMEPVKAALADAGVSAGEIGKVLMVGGSSRIPAVQAAVRSLLGKEPFKGINPDECVAMGACLQGGVLAGAVKGLLLLDVTPLSLGIETLGGVCTRLIQRNTAIPITKSQVFTTAASFQSSVEIHVLQGERPMARQNKTLGRFRLNGIRRAPRGVPQIEVTFAIDANGIVNVSARDLDTGKCQEITIQSSGGMSREEVERAVREAEQYAEPDARERAGAQAAERLDRLLYQGEAARRSMDKTARKPLDEALKRGRQARRHKDPGEMAAAAEALETLLEGGAA